MEAAGESPAEINMGFVEILVIVLGIVAFVGSFLIPESLVKNTSKEEGLPKEKIQELVESEVKQAAIQIEEKVDETMSASAEKTERYMERISNEKVMAIEEYANTVLEQIHKNHEEAVFLYDMLNNKYTQVKNTAAEIGTKVQSVKASENHGNTQIMKNSSEADFSLENREEEKKEVSSSEAEEEKSKPKVKRPAAKRKAPAKKTIKKEGSIDNISNIDIQFEPDANMGSNKEKILSLHQEGKSNMAIAKNLGLGIGEVKLIIDLYESGK